MIIIIILQFCNVSYYNYHLPFIRIITDTKKMIICLLKCYDLKLNLISIRIYQN